MQPGAIAACTVARISLGGGGAFASPGSLLRHNERSTMRPAKPLTRNRTTCGTTATLLLGLAECVSCGLLLRGRPIEEEGGDEDGGGGGGGGGRGAERS